VTKIGNKKSAKLVILSSKEREKKMRNKQGLYKVTGVTKQGERISAFVFADYDFQAVFRLESNLGIRLVSAAVASKPIGLDVWKNTVTNS
jgi:hypothetical protein